MGKVPVKKPYQKSLNFPSPATGQRWCPVTYETQPEIYMYPLFPDIPATVDKNTNKQDFKAQFKRFSKSGFADTIHMPSKKS